MSEMYTKHAETYDSVVRNNIYNACLERPSLQALLDDVQGLDVIDMGCGSGIYAGYFLEQSARSVTCLDVSSDMVSIVKRKFGDKVTAYVQDIAAGLPQEAANSADVIVCPLVLHYLEDLRVVFNDVHRVLKPGGYMVFSTHHPFADFEYSASGNYFATERVQEEWNTVGTPVTVNFYRRSLTDICNAITAAGLVIARLTEGTVSEDAKAISEETYNHLKHNPNFLFVRCEKFRGE